MQKSVRSYLPALGARNLTSTSCPGCSAAAADAAAADAAAAAAPLLPLAVTGTFWAPPAASPSCLLLLLHSNKPL